MDREEKYELNDLAGSLLHALIARGALANTQTAELARRLACIAHGVNVRTTITTTTWSNE